jgi:hypothetical protein
VDEVQILELKLTLKLLTASDFTNATSANQDKPDELFAS